MTQLSSKKTKDFRRQASVLFIEGLNGLKIEFSLQEKSDSRERTVKDTERSKLETGSILTEARSL